MKSEEARLKERQRINAAINKLERGRFGLRRLTDAANLLERLVDLSRAYKANRGR